MSTNGIGGKLKKVRVDLADADVAVGKCTVMPEGAEKKEALASAKEEQKGAAARAEAAKERHAQQTREIIARQTGKARWPYKKSKLRLKAVQLSKTKERDAIKLEDMHGDPKGRQKLALKVFADELRRGISDKEFEGLAGGSATDASSLGTRSAVEVLDNPRKRTNGELVDETKCVEYTGMDRTALIKKGYKMMRSDWEQACKVVGQ
jgi:hypothetical protein